jgi:hypothetical protein
MIERQRHSLFGRRTAGGASPPADDVQVLPDRTVPGFSPPPLPAADESTILGFPVEEPEADDASAVAELPAEQPAAVPPEPAIRLVVLPRADPLAGIALVLAGVAAAASLWVPWVEGDADTGSSLVVRGLTAVGSGLVALDRSGLWQPVAIVLGGVLLLLLGVLLFLPSRTHRVVGVLSLLVASGATAGVLFLMASAGWSTARFGPGMWLAVAVAALGILGALKAMLTVPRVTLKHRGGARR